MTAEQNEKQYHFSELIELGKIRLEQKVSHAPNAEIFVGATISTAGEPLSRFLSEFYGDIQYRFIYAWGVADTMILLPEDITSNELTKSEVDVTKHQLRVIGKEIGKVGFMVLNLGWTKTKLRVGGWEPYIEWLEDESDEIYTIKDLEGLKVEEYEKAKIDYQVGGLATALAYYNSRAKRIKA